MPHIIVKVVAGKSEQQKHELAAQITEDVVRIFNTKEESVSVSIEEVQLPDWPEQVYRPEIFDKPETLYKAPGYNPFA